MVTSFGILLKFGAQQMKHLVHGICNSINIGFCNILKQPMKTNKIPNSHATWKSNIIRFYDRLWNIFSSLGYITSLGYMKLEKIAIIKLYTLTNKDKNTLGSYKIDYKEKGNQRSSLMEKDSQIIIFDFCDNPREFSTIKEVFHTTTRDTFEANCDKSL